MIAVKLKSTSFAPRTWKRLYAAGFVFFFAKGLVWLATPLVLYWLNR